MKKHDSQPGQLSHGLPPRYNDTQRTTKAIQAAIDQVQSKLAKTTKALTKGVNDAKSAAAPDPLAALITSTSVTYNQNTPPASANVGDILIVTVSGLQTPYICTTAYTTGGTLAGNWTHPTNPTTAALCFTNAAAATAAARAAGTKAEVYYSTAAATASGITPNGGDVWMQHDGSFDVIAQWVGVGGSWQTAPVTTAMISNFTAGTVSAMEGSFNVALNSPFISGGVIAGSNRVAAGGTVNTSTGALTITNGIVLEGSGGYASVYYGGSEAARLASTGLTGYNSLGLKITATAGPIHLTGVTDGAASGYAGTGVIFGTVSTSSTAAAAFGTSGQLIYASSSRRFKTEATALIDRYTPDVIRAINLYSHRWQGHPDIPDGTRDLGPFAEELGRAGHEELITRRLPGGDIIAARYERFGLLGLALAQHLADVVDQQATDLADLRQLLTEQATSIADLTSRVTALEPKETP